jgi:hypothetical protein
LWSDASTIALAENTPDVVRKFLLRAELVLGWSPFLLLQPAHSLQDDLPKFRPEIACTVQSRFCAAANHRWLEQHSRSCFGYNCYLLMGADRLRLSISRKCSVGKLALVSLCAASQLAISQTTATIDIDTATTIPVAPGFSGVSDDLGFPVEYWDYRFNALAAQVGYGWVRFPGGNSSDIYNWQTGQQVAAWLAQLGANAPPGAQNSIASVAGRGGARLIDAANRANLFGATFIAVANGFTDTPQSIGQLAAYVKANNIHVAAWELSNEPYLYPEIFADATTYLDKMKPYRDAIKAVDPNAIIAIFIRDPGNSNATNTWDTAVAAYPNKYWEAISFHHYPSQSTGNFAQWMADENAVLVNKTSSLVTNQLTPIGPSGVKFINSEFDPTIPNDSKTGATSITCGTLWGGIYAAEFTMRMSTLPSVLHVGPNEIVRYAGVFPTSDFTSEVTAAAKAGKPIDTETLDFGFYLSAQAAGQAVLNGVINRAVNSNKTTVTGGATVPATGVNAGIPALYAMSYTNATGACPSSLPTRARRRTRPTSA